MYSKSTALDRIAPRVVPIHSLFSTASKPRLSGAAPAIWTALTWMVWVLLIGLASASSAANLTVHAREDAPSPVDIRIVGQHEDGSGQTFDQTLNWIGGTNNFTSQMLVVPNGTTLFRLSFENDQNGPTPDTDRNAFIDYIEVDGNRFEGEAFDATGGPDLNFPGCNAVTVMPSMTDAADCGNQGDWIELGTGEPFGTTVISHGFTLGLYLDEVSGVEDNCRSTLPKPTGCTEVLEPVCGAPKPNPRAPGWELTMGEALAVRMGGGTCVEDVQDSSVGATVLEYHPCSGEWVFYCGSGDPNDPIILAFNWIVESDNLDQTEPQYPDYYGGTWGYTQGAGEALYAALRDPQFSDGNTPGSTDSLDGTDLLASGLHLIGHSRGTAIMTEVSNRIGDDNLTVEHLTLLDPHPVDGLSGEDPLDWGDRVPGVYAGVTWSDTYWRQDLNPLDFDGESVMGSYARNLECVLPETILIGDHSRVHTWYHGTIDLLAPDDGAGRMIDLMWYDNDESGGRCTPIPARDLTGFYFTRGVGQANRPDYPNQAPRLATTMPPTLYNSDFDAKGPLGGYSHTGWRYHGGDKLGDAWDIDPLDPQNYMMQLASGPLPAESQITHNRFYLNPNDKHFAYDHRVVAAGGGTLNVRIHSVDGLDTYLVDTVSLTGIPQAGWTTKSRQVPAFWTGRAYTLEFELVGSGIIDIDDIVLSSATNVPLMGPFAGLVLWASLSSFGVASIRRMRRS